MKTTNLSDLSIADLIALYNNNRYKQWVAIKDWDIAIIQINEEIQKRIASINFEK